MSVNDVSHENALAIVSDDMSVKNAARDEDAQYKIRNIRIDMLKIENEVSMLETIIVGVQKERRMMDAVTQSLEETVKNKRAKYCEISELIKTISVALE